jgi:hypothetical protein
MNTQLNLVGNDKTNHRLKIRQSKRPNELLAAIYLQNDKYPYIGSWFNKSVNISEIIQWAETQVKLYPQNCIL